MDFEKVDLREFHWMMDLLQSIDIGLIVLDKDNCVQLWNGFMANHSGKIPAVVNGKDLFSLFPELPEQWLRHKLESVLTLNNRAFSTWEQRPFLFEFNNYRPVTGTADFMYQNITFIPLISIDGAARHVGIIIYDVTDVATSQAEIQSANKLLACMSRTDQLTLLYNRGYWEECLMTEFNRIKRTAEPTTLVMFDIDHFKKVNDTYGHPAGDEVIRRTAADLRACVRATDVAGRYGGEEFAIILINASAEASLVVAERLRKKIEDAVVIHDDQEIRYTVSLGLAQMNDAIVDHKQWIERADKALYQAKESGRNKSVIYKK